MPGFWRNCRIGFRCVRFGIWFAVLLVLGAFLWCNRIGLPGFIKTRIVASLHEQGLDLEFSRMRLSLARGLIAENVHIGESQTREHAAVGAREVRLQLDFSAFLRRRLELNGLILKDGFFFLPLSPTNELTLTNLQTDLRFGEAGTWSLDHFRAHFAGALIAIRGEVTHAPEAAHWKMFGGASSDRSAIIASKRFLRRVENQ